jgi:hypothetical protein
VPTAASSGCAIMHSSTKRVAVIAMRSCMELGLPLRV